MSNSLLSSLLRKVFKVSMPESCSVLLLTQCQVTTNRNCQTNFQTFFYQKFEYHVENMELKYDNEIKLDINRFE